MASWSEGFRTPPTLDSTRDGAGFTLHVGSLLKLGEWPVPRRYSVPERREHTDRFLRPLDRQTPGEPQNSPGVATPPVVVKKKPRQRGHPQRG